MWRSVDALHRHMDPHAAAAELRAQIDMALALGIDVTHIDTHMGSVIHPRLISAYIGLAVEYQIPLMLPRVTEKLLIQEGIDPALADAFAAVVDQLAATGFPVLDYTCALREEGDRLDGYRRLFADLPAGITHIRTHPSLPGSGINAITASAPDRIADYQTFLRPELKAYAAEQGIHLFGYRPLRALIRGQRS